jgi:hypothetical protein
MIGIYWPPAWLAFVPVVAIEAWWARRAMGVSWSSALAATFTANLVSTFVGIPLVWFALAVVQLRFAGGALGIDNLARGMYAFTVQSPWLIPYEGHFWWMIPAASLVLTIAFCAASVGIEWLVIKGLYRRRDNAELLRWLWRGNLCSYVLILAVVVGFLYVPRTALDRFAEGPVDTLAATVMRTARRLMPQRADAPPAESEHDAAVHTDDSPT